MEHPLLSIVLPAYNEEVLLPRTLESLQQAFGPLCQNELEIVVCDNNSTDRTHAVAEAAGARVVFEPHNQIAKARNTGARAARGQWLVFVDADTCIPPRLAELTLAAIRSGQIGAGGAPVHFDTPPRERVPRFFIAAWNWVSRSFRLAAGSYIFCRRDAWLNTGGFDEAYYAGEEIFFSLRLKKWCRQNRLRFKILSEPVVTSARKLHWHSQSQIWKAVLRAAWPGAITRREDCAFWYNRPS